MADEEKKISLEELPDEGSLSVPRPAGLRKKIKKLIDPRLESLKAKDDASKVEAMIQKWTFDEPVLLHGWMIFISLILIIQFSSLHDIYMAEMIALPERSLMGAIFGDTFWIFRKILRFPVVFLLLTPVFFKFHQPSECAFTLGFDGIETVKRIFPKGSKEIVSRTFVKWADIQKVEKVFLDSKEVIRFYAHDGHIADLVWYIDINKKKSVKLILERMVPPEHPFRIFLDNEKELS